MGGGGIGGIGEIASGGGFSSMLSGDFDLGKMAGTASNFLPPPYNLAAGAAAGLLGQGGMGGFDAASVTDALGGLGLDQNVLGGITDAATALQNDPSQQNIDGFFQSLQQIPEEKREEAMKALMENMPPEVQQQIQQMMQGGGLPGATGPIG